MKTQKKKILIVICCIAVGIIAVTGIAVGPGRVLAKKYQEIKHKALVRDNLQKAHDDEYVQAQMMDYLEERYHEKFVMKYYQCHLGTWNGNYVEMGAWPEGKEDEEHFITVEGHPNAEGNLDFYDSYVKKRVKKEMEDYFQPYVDKYYDGYLSYWIFSLGGNLPADISLEELFAQKVEAEMFLSIHVEQQEVDSNLGNLESLAKELQDHKFRGTFSVDLFETDKNKSDGKLYRYYRTYEFHISDEKIEMTERTF